MKSIAHKLDSPYLHSFQIDLSCQPVRRWINKVLDAGINILIVAIVLAVIVLSFSASAKTQTQLITTGTSPTAETSTPAAKIDFIYTPPTARTKINNYLFDAFGPYPVMGGALGAGIGQFSNSPPEWGQGFSGYSRRFGSDFGMLAVGTTTRYALTAAFQEDSLYYRCECTSVFPRFSHAVFSTFTARRGTFGHRVISLPALVAPYAGSMAAVFGWYPDRFGAKDAFRIGNYNMLAYVGGNVALEFLYRGPRSLITRMHLNNAHGAPEQGPNQ